MMRFCEIKGVILKSACQEKKKKVRWRQNFLSWRTFRGAKPRPRWSPRLSIAGWVKLERTWLQKLPHVRVLPAAGWRAPVPGSPWPPQSPQHVEGLRASVAWSSLPSLLGDLPQLEFARTRARDGRRERAVPPSPLAPPPRLPRRARARAQSSLGARGAFFRELGRPMHLPSTRGCCRMFLIWAALFPCTLLPPLPPVGRYSVFPPTLLCPDCEKSYGAFIWVHSTVSSFLAGDWRPGKYAVVPLLQWSIVSYLIPPPPTPSTSSASEMLDEHVGLLF